MTAFSAEHFERFCGRLVIDTKERGQQPLKWIGTQRYFVQEVAKGLADGVHTFVVLKGRQLGITTVSLALDLYWMFMHPGLQGALITDTDGNKQLFKSYLSQYLKALPPKSRVKPVEHNREQLILANRSRMAYIAAGKRKNESLGAGKAVNFMHATECASWGDEEGLKSLIATLAQQNPNRIYVFESTAFGYNMWYEMWQKAKDAESMRAIFIGWWMNEFYVKGPETPEFRSYWDGELSQEESTWVREVYELYGHNIKPEQIAWWRWYLNEMCQGDLNVMYQQFPPTEDYAFQMSGSKYFSGERVNAMYQKTLAYTGKYFRYNFGNHFDQIEFHDTNEQNAEVTIYEEPKPEGVYVLGADPAYGSSEWADEFAISILRCYADRVVQVCEVATTDYTEAQFAWVIAHLAGNYSSPANPCMVNLEMQGPGGAVFNELQNIRRFASAHAGMVGGKRELYDVIGSIRDYMWRKQDSIMGGFAYQWQTNAKEKLRLFSTLRNYFERDMIEVRSSICAAQFRNIHREGDSIGGEGRAKDDRVVALGISVIAWNDWIMHEMQARNRTFAIESQAREDAPQLTTIQRAVMKHFKQNGIHYGKVE